MDDTILRVDDIQKFYGNKGNLTKAVDHISFSVRKGEFLGIMGSSGSGKTTLLNCISTIDTVTSGHIYVEGKDITTLHGSQLADFRGKKLGFIFQDFNLLDTLTAYENISLALSIAGTKPSEIQKCVPQIAKALNIQEVLNKYPYQMSGGQQQRVAAGSPGSDGNSGQSLCPGGSALRWPTAAGSRCKSNGNKSSNRTG